MGQCLSSRLPVKAANRSARCRDAILRVSLRLPTILRSPYDSSVSQFKQSSQITPLTSKKLGENSNLVFSTIQGSRVSSSLKPSFLTPCLLVNSFIGRLVVWSFGCLVVWGFWGLGGGFILLRKHRNRRDVVRRVRRCVGGAIGKSNNLFTRLLVYSSTCRMFFFLFANALAFFHELRVYYQSEVSNQPFLSFFFSIAVFNHLLNTNYHELNTNYSKINS